MNRIDMAGRTVVITGGARGIGYAIGERLVHSGARVALWDLRAEEAEASAAALSKDCIGVSVDVSDSLSVEHAAQQTKAAFGRIDGLVNGAGITGPVKPLAEYSVEEWRSVVEVNLTGTFNCCRSIVPIMLENDYGRIVNIASVAGKEGNPNLAAYSAAKAGI